MRIIPPMYSFDYVKCYDFFPFERNETNELRTEIVHTFLCSWGIRPEQRTNTELFIAVWKWNFIQLARQNEMRIKEAAYFYSIAGWIFFGWFMVYNLIFRLSFKFFFVFFFCRSLEHFQICCVILCILAGLCRCWMRNIRHQKWSPQALKVHRTKHINNIQLFDLLS